MELGRQDAQLRLKGSFYEFMSTRKQTHTHTQAQQHSPSLYLSENISLLSYPSHIGVLSTVSIIGQRCLSFYSFGVFWGVCKILFLWRLTGGVMGGVFLFAVSLTPSIHGLTVYKTGAYRWSNQTHREDGCLWCMQHRRA